jgi:hypothetical protein
VVQPSSSQNSITHTKTSSKSHAATSNATGKKIGTAGRNTFTDVDKPFMPYAIPAWKSALGAVEQKYAPSGSTTLGYAFPDPNLIASSKNCAQYLMNWLGWRAACIWHTTNEHCDLFDQAKAQDWRDFLGHSLEKALQVDKDGNPLPVTSSSSHAQTCKHKAADFFTGFFSLTEKPETVFWQAHAILTGDAVKIQEALLPEVTTEILWDLFEHNFRFELLALDHVFNTNQWNSSPDYLVRNNLLCGVFFDDCGDAGGMYLVQGLPDRNYGLGADDWQGRRYFVETLRQVMLTWPGSEKLPQDELSEDQDIFFGEEEAVAKFYCQSFYDKFRRAAVVPHRLKQSSSSFMLSVLPPPFPAAQSSAALSG